MAEERDDYHSGGVPGDTEPVPLLGSVTGYAKEVVCNIRRAAISAQLQNFLLEVYARSFGNAGYQRRAGIDNPGGSCLFDNASWARELEMQRQHMYRLRVRAVELGILLYEEDPADPSRGRLMWNLAFDEWKPLDGQYRRQRYSRPGAGRKSNGLRSAGEEIKRVTPASRTDKSNGLHSVGETKSNGLRQPAIEQIKLVTLVSLESASEAARDDALRKVTEERDTEEPDANASGAAHADASPPSSPSVSNKPVRHPRKLTDVQLEAHGLEQQWCREVLAELARRLDVKTVPRAGQQKEAAKWFYRELLGVDESQKRLWQCYDLTKRSPFWRDKTLLLSDLLRPFPEYRRDPAGYRAAIERECQEGKSNGKLSGNRRNSAGRDRSASEPRKFTDEWYDWREREHQRARGVGSSAPSSV